MVKRRKWIRHHARSGRYKKRVYGQRHKVGKELSFYDLKARKKFKTSNYRILKKKGRRFAITTAPSGVKSYRIV